MYTKPTWFLDQFGEADRVKCLCKVLQNHADQSLDQHSDVYQFHCALRGVDLHKIYLSRSHTGGHIVGI